MRTNCIQRWLNADDLIPGAKLVADSTNFGAVNPFTIAEGFEGAVSHAAVNEADNRELRRRMVLEELHRGAGSAEHRPDAP
jgi:hypothetical protein